MADDNVVYIENEKDRRYAAHIHTLKNMVCGGVERTRFIQRKPEIISRIDANTAAEGNPPRSTRAKVENIRMKVQAINAAHGNPPIEDAGDEPLPALESDDESDDETVPELVENWLDLAGNGEDV